MKLNMPTGACCISDTSKSRGMYSISLRRAAYDPKRIPTAVEVDCCLLLVDALAHKEKNVASVFLRVARNAYCLHSQRLRPE